jgi:hypothetical protein
MLKALGILLLVVLILVGALMPLKYTARMHLPKPREDGPGTPESDSKKSRAPGAGRAGR